MCREGVAFREDQNEARNLGRGLNASILMMLAVPLVLGGGLAWMIYVNTRGRGGPPPVG